MKKNKFKKIKLTIYKDNKKTIIYKYINSMRMIIQTIWYHKKKKPFYIRLEAKKEKMELYLINLQFFTKNKMKKNLFIIELQKDEKI